MRAASAAQVKAVGDYNLAAAALVAARKAYNKAQRRYAAALRKAAKWIKQ